MLQYLNTYLDGQNVPNFFTKAGVSEDFLFSSLITPAL